MLIYAQKVHDSVLMPKQSCGILKRNVKKDAVVTIYQCYVLNLINSVDLTTINISPSRKLEILSIKQLFICIQKLKLPCAFVMYYNSFRYWTFLIFFIHSTSLSACIVG